MLKAITDNLGNAGKMLQMKQQKDKMDKLMSSVSTTGYSSNKKVMVRINGKMDIIGFTIDPTLITFVYENSVLKEREDTIIQKSVIEAYKEAQDKIQPELMKKMQESGDINDIMDMMKGM